MAVGKNKRLSKGGKKGSKKKIVDPFTRKEWYDVKAPSMFAKRQIGKTLVNKTQGIKISSDFLKHRVFEVSLGDLQDTEADFRKFRLIVEDVQGRNCLTNFHGMSFTKDKLCSLVKKHQTLIEANCAVKTTDGYLLRLFCIAFTKKQQSTTKKKTCYAKMTKQRAIRAKMIEIIVKEVGSSDLKEVVNKLIPDSIGRDIEKTCSGIYPLHDVYIRKVKILKKPKIDVGRLMDMHGDSGKATGEGGNAEDSTKPEGYEPPVMEAV